jgi:hypothetical protein
MTWTRNTPSSAGSKTMSPSTLSNPSGTTHLVSMGLILRHEGWIRSGSATRAEALHDRLRPESWGGGVRKCVGRVGRVGREGS